MFKLAVVLTEIKADPLGEAVLYQYTKICDLYFLLASSASLGGLIHPS